MKKLSQCAPEEALKLIIYGASFTGKSTVVSKLASDFNLIWFDLENGHRVLFKLPPEQQDKITLVKLKDTRSYPIAIETVLKVVKGKPVSICDKHGKIACPLCRREETDAGGTEHHLDFFTDVELNALGTDTIVVFDSMTQLVNSAIAHITKNEPDDYKLNYDDWGNLGKLMDIFLSHIQQANCHIIVISHEQEIESEAKKGMIAPVGGTRNFSRNLPRFFDVAVYAEIKNCKHRYSSSTTANNKIVAGERGDIAIENFPDDPNPLLRIFKPELGGTSPTDSNPNKQASKILNKLSLK